MITAMPTSEIETITSFGSYLRFLRRRARLTQIELSIAVGYSPGQISMLENGQRSPNPTTIAALFVPALGIQQDEHRCQHLLALAETASPAHERNATHELVAEAVLVTREELGQLEQIPWVPAYTVLRAAAQEQLREWLTRDRHVVLCGMGGMGKSTLAAQLARQEAQQSAVFWMTCTNPATLAPEPLLRQLALFASTQIAEPQQLAAVLCQPAAGTPTIAYAQQLAMIAKALSELEAALLVFDDAQLLHHSPQVNELISQLIKRVPQCRMLFVTREELSLPDLVHMHLGGLEADELALLHARLANTSVLNLKRLQQQTGGSPMLVRLALSYWEQHGASNNDVLPSPVASYLIDSILNTLPAAARRLLDVLALWRGPLDLTQASLAEQLRAHWQEHDHQAGLLHIQRSRLIEQLTQATPHPLLREPLLLALTNQAGYARQLHGVLAELALVLNDPVRAAHHLSEAGDFLRAYTLISAQSGQQQLPGQDLTRAAVVDELLARLAGQRYTPQWQEAIFKLLILRGDLLAHSTRADDAQASYYEALRLAHRPIDQAAVAEKIALCAYRRGAFDEALTLCDQATSSLGLNLSKEAIGLRMQIEATRIRVLITLARVDEARQLCETALTQISPLTLILPELAGTIRASANLTLGYIARLQGDNSLARYHLHKSAQQARNIHASSVEADALQYLSATLRDMGDMQAAEDIGQKALELAHTSGNEYLMSNILHHLSLTDYYHGDLERAIWRTQRVLQLKIPMGDIDGMVASRMLQAITLVAQGNIRAAWEAANQAGLDCDLLENSWLRGIADFGYAIVLSVTNELAAAERHLLRALATTMLKRDIPFYTGTQMYLALVYVAQGRLLEAESIIAPELASGAGYSAELLRELVRAMWLLGHMRCEEAHSCALQLIERAKKTGFLIYAQEGTRLAALSANPPALAELPRRICCPEHVTW